MSSELKDLFVKFEQTEKFFTQSSFTQKIKSYISQLEKQVRDLSKENQELKQQISFKNQQSSNKIKELTKQIKQASSFEKSASIKEKQRQQQQSKSLQFNSDQEESEWSQNKLQQIMIKENQNQQFEIEQSPKTEEEDQENQYLEQNEDFQQNQSGNQTPNYEQEVEEEEEEESEKLTDSELERELFGIESDSEASQALFQKLMKLFEQFKEKIKQQNWNKVQQILSEIDEKIPIKFNEQIKQFFDKSKVLIYTKQVIQENDQIPNIIKDFMIKLKDRWKQGYIEYKKASNQKQSDEKDMFKNLKNQLKIEMQAKNDNKILNILRRLDDFLTELKNFDFIDQIREKLGTYLKFLIRNENQDISKKSQNLIKKLQNLGDLTNSRQINQKEVQKNYQVIGEKIKRRYEEQLNKQHEAKVVSGFSTGIPYKVKKLFK